MSVTEHELRLIGIEAFNAQMAAARQAQQGSAAASREVDQALRGVERNLQTQTGLLARAQAGWAKYSSFVGGAGGALGKLTFGAQTLGSAIGFLTGGPLGGPLGGLIVSLKAAWDGLSNLIDPIERIDPAVRASGEAWSYLTSQIKAFSAEVDRAKAKAAEVAKAGEESVRRVSGLAGVDPSQMSLQGRLDIDRQATARQYAIDKVEQAYARYKDLDAKVAEAESRANGRISSALYYQQRELAALRAEYEALQQAIPADTTKVGTNLSGGGGGGGGGGPSVFERSRREADAAARAAERDALYRSAAAAGAAAREASLRDSARAGEGVDWNAQRQRVEGERAELAQKTADALAAQNAEVERSRAAFGGVGGAILDLTDTTITAGNAFNSVLGSMSGAIAKFAVQSIISGKASGAAAREAVAESAAATATQLFVWGTMLELAAPFAGIIPGLGPGLGGTMAAGGVALLGGAATLALIARGLGGKNVAGGGGGSGGGGGGGGGGSLGPTRPMVPASSGGGTVVNNYFIDNTNAVYADEADERVHRMVYRAEQRARVSRGVPRIGA